MSVLYVYVVYIVQMCKLDEFFTHNYSPDFNAKAYFSTCAQLKDASKSEGFSIKGIFMQKL